MEEYNPNSDPQPEEWLKMPESERLDLIRDFHDQEGCELPDIDSHCSMHAIIENQIAMDSPAMVKKTLLRLLSAGVDRHEAIHAIANALSQELFRMMKNNEMFSEGRYDKMLEKLKPTDWKLADNQTRDSDSDATKWIK